MRNLLFIFKSLVFKSLVFLFIILMFSCHKNKNNNLNVSVSHKEGEITLNVDPAFDNLAEALVSLYESDYPKTKINIKEEAENKIINDFLSHKAFTIIAGRDLLEDEKKYLPDYTATQIACDAVIFITSRQNTENSINLDEIKNQAFKKGSRFIFDAPNSASFNLIKEKLKIEEVTSIVSLENSEEVVKYVAKHKKSIGIIGYNVISSPTNKEIIKNIKVLSINNNGEEVFPSLDKITHGEYPFSRRIYILNSRKKYGIGAGLATLAASERGQLIVEKEGLQPYYLFERKIQIH